ncbi:Trypsin-like protease precursor [compost metagenome]
MIRADLFLIYSSMKTKNLYVTSLFVFGLVGCAPSPQTASFTKDSAIIGGRLTSASSEIAKHLVMIYTEENHSICTGTLIHSRVVLTAAHCVSKEADSMIITFGVDPLSGAYVKRTSDAFIIHDDYNKKEYFNRNDIALIRLSKPAPKAYVPALLPTKKLPLKVDFNFTALGFGRALESPSAQDFKNNSGRLRETILKIEEIYSEDSQFKVDQQSGRGVCSGDSGGPAIMRFSGKNYVVGIASAVWWQEGTPENTCSQKSIYMNVKHYRDWILENLDGLVKKSP